jgi:hypothetical protein
MFQAIPSYCLIVLGLEMVDEFEHCWDHASSPKVLQEETLSAKPVYT